MIAPYVFPLSSISFGAAIETTVANIASPTELNSLGTTQGEIRLARTTEAGTGTQTWYYLDTTSDAQSLPYIVTSATAGLKWIAFGGRYCNEAVNILGILTAASSLSVTSTATVGGLLTASSGLTVTSTTTLSGLTASRLVRTDGSKQLESNAALTSTNVLYADSNGWPTGDSNLTVTSTVFTLGSTRTANFANTTSASSATAGAVTIGNGTAATNVAIGGGKINAGGTLDIGGVFTQIATAPAATPSWLGADSIRSSQTTNNVCHIHIGTSGATVGYAMAIGSTRNVTSFLYDSGAGVATIRSNSVDALTVSSTVFTATSSVSASFANTTDATSSSTGAVQGLGGANFAKNLLHRQGRGAGFATTATAAGTTTLTSASKEVQAFTGTTTQTVQFPAANLFGANISVLFTINNQSTGTVTSQRAGSDTFQGGGTTDAVLSGATTRYASDGVSLWMKA